MKKILLTIGGIFITQNIALANITLFTDLNAEHPDFDIIIDLAQRGVFTGVDGKADLGSPIFKDHAILMLMKLQGLSPDINQALAAGWITEIPKAGTILSKAEWSVILTRAFNTNIETIPGDQWFQGAYDAAITLNAFTPIDIPNQSVNRGFALRSASVFEQALKVKLEQILIVEVEQALMTIRNNFLDENYTSIELETDIWDSIQKINTIIGSQGESLRVKAIEDYLMVFVIMLHQRNTSEPTALTLRNNRITFFINEGVRQLPASIGFANDLRQMNGLQ